MDALGTWSTVAGIKWDTPYRLVASFVGLLAVGPYFVRTEGRLPTENFISLLELVGLDAPNWALTTHDWMTDSSRVELIRGVALILALLSLGIVVNNSKTFRVSRASSSFWLLLAILAEITVVHRWQILIGIGVALAVAFFYRLRVKYGEISPGVIVFELLISLLYVVLLPVIWIVGSARASEASKA